MALKEKQNHLNNSSLETLVIVYNQFKTCIYTCKTNIDTFYDPHVLLMTVSCNLCPFCVTAPLHLLPRNII